MRGNCRKCGGRIALIGVPGEAGQWASLVEDEVAPRQQASERQVAALRGLGVSEEQLQQLDKTSARRMLQHLNPAGPTDKQLAYLRQLGASEHQIAALISRTEASALIEEMHLQPTRAQIDFLRKLGMAGDRLARIRSRGEASALIEELKGGR